ncbi:MAG: helix-turn-helix domain-containing protein [Planctomycetes bacterium]|nr:helix-turn-helix domain-containing protein [Planctomycetota bacterium]
MKELFTTGEAAEICQVSPMTIIRYCDSGRIGVIKSPVTGVRRIPRKALIEFMEQYDISMDRLKAFETFNVFVLTDKPSDIETIRNVVEPMEQDFEIESSTGGYAGLIRLGIYQPDFVVVNTDISGLDPAEICQSIRTVTEFRPVRTLAIAGDSSAQIEGAHDVIGKPVSAASLKDKIRDLLELS